MIRTQIKPNQIKYDNSHDVLHVYFPPLEISEDEENYPGVIIRRAIKNERIIGFIILDFNKKKESLKYLLPTYDFSKIKV